MMWLLCVWKLDSCEALQMVAGIRLQFEVSIP